MTDTTNRYDHDRSPYERPNLPFRCGREAAFGKPCPKGPSGNGTCQGISDCTPFQTRKLVLDEDTGEEREILRWECRRPAWAGGPCPEGPKPDGTCSCTHPPCAPRPTLRRQRGRWALLAVAAVFTLAIALMGFGGAPTLPSSTNPGELSGKHAQFTAAEGCVACHESHSTSLVGWVGAVFSKNTISDSCVSCHSFGKEPAVENEPSKNTLLFAAHNWNFPNNPNALSTDCQGCHTEHRGELASITPLVDGQCAGCHTEKFDNFSKGHPEFSNTFPNQNPRTIKFSHSNHLEEYFADSRYKELAPKENCVSCHTKQENGRLLPGSFDTGCAGCHEQAIREQGFAVIGLPELSDPTLTADAAETCGFSQAEIEPAKTLISAVADSISSLNSVSEAFERNNSSDLKTAVTAAADTADALTETKAELEEAFDREEAVSLEYLPAVLSYLLKHPSDDLDAYSEDVASLLIELAQNGYEPLSELLEATGGSPNNLLAGLSDELVQRVVCAWTANQEYEALRDPEPGKGWQASPYQISYMPTGHSDSVVRNWIEFSLSEEVRESDLGNQVTEKMLHPADGPGRCFKCHVAPVSDPSLTTVTWKIPSQDLRPFTEFNHTPHLNVLNVGSGCATCHQGVETSKTTSGEEKNSPSHPKEFGPIKKSVCSDCHKEGGVQQTCVTCHQYHTEPTIRKRQN
ncbi:MAG: cytochrome c3 family protein [Rhodospirillales bacterium]